MEKDFLLSLDDKWMEGSGSNVDVVISSRIRLARNLLGIPFPQVMTENEIPGLLDKINLALTAGKEKFNLWSLKDLSALERQVIVEKHLISPEHARAGRGAVFLNQDRSISIMALEEDHLRIQVILPALNIMEAWITANQIDDLLEAKLEFAFNEKYGYLTACPTNVGTGLRASVMMHLPGLALTRQVDSILRALSQVGLVVRGIYGEGTEALGNIFQISNQITLGRNEQEIISNLSSVVVKIIDQEKNARDALMQEAGGVLTDRIYRAYGTLTNARVISSQEALTLLSSLKLGMDLKIITGLETRLFNQLMVSIQPAYLQYSMEKEMSSTQRDEYRADKIREILKA